MVELRSTSRSGISSAHKGQLKHHICNFVAKDKKRVFRGQYQRPKKKDNRTYERFITMIRMYMRSASLSHLKHIDNKYKSYIIHI